MILGFKQKFPWGEPTYFREKILLPTKPRILAYGAAETWYPKIHTMRSDPHNRWKAGRSIQMVYRGPNYSIQDHFNKGIPELEKCVSTQKVKIINCNESVPDKTLGFVDCILVRGVEFHNYWMVFVDDDALTEYEIEQLAI